MAVNINHKRTREPVVLPPNSSMKFDGCVDGAWSGFLSGCLNDFQRKDAFVCRMSCADQISLDSGNLCMESEKCSGFPLQAGVSAQINGD